MSDFVYILLGCAAAGIVLGVGLVVIVTNRWPWQWRRRPRFDRPDALDLQCPECLWWAPTPEARDAHLNIAHRRRV